MEQHLAELEARGIRVAAISVDAPEVSRNLAAKRGYTYTFLSDPNAEVIRRYDLLHPKALLDSRGTVCWVNLTENYWVRATPEQMLEATKLVRY
ncbi:MAG: hypothetical protein DMG67_07740 [Acidobacteria bacterium]|nr:MAG: hypothetical protein DMG67_07740 [Acidobacteriota bacterium]